jgi:uncharacterized protein YpmB
VNHQFYSKEAHEEKSKEKKDNETESEETESEVEKVGLELTIDDRILDFANSLDKNDKLILCPYVSLEDMLPLKRQFFRLLWKT